MKKETRKMYIIGAGVSGLIAAYNLENKGVRPIIIESTDRVGGRLKTDFIDGFQLDHGFQVLLSSYSAAKKYLDYNGLQLQKLKSGACIFSNGKRIFFGDLLKDRSIMFSTIFSNIGSLLDKIKIAKLNFMLQNKSVEDIFEDEEISTIDYLNKIGFSENIINHFFFPFFNGIFLETELKTSSRMFEFVFKMFGDGHAVLPKSGIEEIPKQLKSKLKNTEFIFNTKVLSVQKKEIYLSNGKKLKSDFTIIATEPNHLISNLKNQHLDWKSCQTLYFSTPNRIYKKPYIGLIADKESLINNIFYPTSINSENRKDKELISVTVIKKHNLSENELVSKINKELKVICNIDKAKFLKIYNIPKALPKLENLQNDISPTETKLKDGIYLSGDVLLNSSLNAAIIAGERAAQGVLEEMGKTKVLA